MDLRPLLASRGLSTCPLMLDPLHQLCLFAPYAAKVPRDLDHLCMFMKGTLQMLSIRLVTQTYNLERMNAGLLLVGKIRTCEANS